MNVSLGSGYANREFPRFWEAPRSFPEGLYTQPEQLPSLYETGLRLYTDRMTMTNDNAVSVDGLEPESPQVRFVGGTLVLDHVGQDAQELPLPFKWVNAKWRCPAFHYRTLRPWFKRQGIRNRAPRWRTLSLTLEDNRESYAYQTEALQIWQDAGRWGSIVLPTGAGKTFVALQAIARCAVSTLVVVPTLDLLHQPKLPPYLDWASLYGSRGYITLK